MATQTTFQRINKPFLALKEQITIASPVLTRPELLDLADQIHEIIRTRHFEYIWDAQSRTSI